MFWRFHLLIANFFNRSFNRSFWAFFKIIYFSPYIFHKTLKFTLKRRLFSLLLKDIVIFAKNPFHIGPG